MEQPRLVLDILIVLVSAGVGGAIFEKMRMPGVIGFLLTGALVGPGGLQLISDPEEVRTFAEFGVAFLLFEIAIELPLKELRYTFRKLILSGLLQVVATLGSVTAICVWGGLPLNTSIVMGMLVTMSSTAVVMRILRERGEVDAPHGRLSLGILLFQDLFIIPFLLAIPLLTVGGQGSLETIGFSIVRAILVLFLFSLAARFVLPWVMKQIAHLRSTDLFSIFSFLLAMGSAVVAQEIGLTLAAGAFVAGLVLNTSAYGHQLFSEIVPWRGVLLGVFFTTIGMLLDVQSALLSWKGILLFLGGVMVLKPAIITNTLYWVLRERAGQAIQTGLTLGQAGEFSFVLATAASIAGLIDGPTEQVFIAGSILSLVFTPVLISLGPKVADWGSAPIEKMRGKTGVNAVMESKEVDDCHVVIIGYGMAGRTLAQVLRPLGLRYRIVDSNPYTEGKLKGTGEPFTFGDATRPVILKAVGVERAKVVVIAISDPVATRRCISMIR
ncbi:MAG: cation:proton antiporter, partial [Deltaproteobacteria bacterium]|nr:cation:proton antiporter [Deltaproteobacteria bacterium]